MSASPQSTQLPVARMLPATVTTPLLAICCWASSVVTARVKLQQAYVRASLLDLNFPTCPPVKEADFCARLRVPDVLLFARFPGCEP